MHHVSKQNEKIWTYYSVYVGGKDFGIGVHGVKSM